MIDEISSVGDATERLNHIYSNFTKKELFEPLANMLNLLSDMSSGNFENALEDVSRDIWRTYQTDAVKDLPNRFTRSLMIYANSNYGFTATENVVFGSPLSGRDFGHYVKTGKLWKDSIALGHGEFSHTYQWLACGKVFNWGKNTGEIYKAVAATKGAMSAIQVWDKNDQQQIVKQNLPLWGYLVDCLDYKHWYEKDDKDFPILNAFTNWTYRSPTQVASLVRMKKDWFISFYENHRYFKMQNAQETGQKMLRDQAVPARKGEKLSRKEKDTYKAVEGIKKQRTEHYTGEKSGWFNRRPGVFERSVTDPGILDSERVPQEMERAKTKPQVLLSFHNITGYVPQSIEVWT